MNTSQTGILEAIPSVARYLTFDLVAGADATTARAALASVELSDGRLVVGLGEGLVTALGAVVPGLRTLAPLDGAGVHIPAAPHALWCWLRGDDRGEVLVRSKGLAATLEAAGFRLVDVVDAFAYDGGRDLSGYEDGTENPEGDEAVDAAFVQDAGPALDGSSFVAVQTWRHDLATFNGFSGAERDHIVGRRISDNEEIADAPESAHVKRTAQESFEPEAFVLRRSMPWSAPDAEGLVFVAFGSNFDKFEMQLRRMAGLDDGITDALFRWSQPLNGAYYWCPPVTDGRLALAALASN